MSELGRRAVACAGWRLLEGMIDTHCNRIVSVEPGEVRTVDWGAEEVQEGAAFGVPDLSDPCTLGGLLALVREAWGDVGACAVGVCFDGEVHWTCDVFDMEFAGQSEAEALVAALEAAP